MGLPAGFSIQGGEGCFIKGWPSISNVYNKKKLAEVVTKIVAWNYVWGE